MSERRNLLLHPLIDGLIRFRFALLIGGLLLLAAAFPLARQLEFDQRIESLYAPNDPHLRSYLESKSLFGGDEFVIVAYRDPHLFVPGSVDEGEPRLTSAARQRIESLARQLNAIEGVWAERTQHLALKLPFPGKAREIVELSEGMLVGEDRQTTAIVLRLEPDATTSAETFDEILKIARQHDPPAYVVGEPLQIHYMFRYVEEDGRVLFVVSLALLGSVLLLFFARPQPGRLATAFRWGPKAASYQLLTAVVRIAQWVGLPLLVVVTTILWTEAALVLFGAKLSMVSSMLNSLVTIIGIATVTHVTVHYRQLRRRQPRPAALRQTLIELLPAIFWTCMTTVAGFAALLYSSITPVQSFAVMMALAAALVFVAVAAILPGGILIGRLSTDPLDAPFERGLTGGLVRLVDAVQRHPRPVAVISVVLVAFTFAGLFRLEVETDFSKNFRESSPLVQGLQFVETRLGGAGTWEVNFPAPHSLNDDYLDRVERLTRALRQLNAGEENAPHLTKVVSLTDGLSLVPEEIDVPILGQRKLSIPRRLTLVKVMQEDFTSSLYNPRAGRMRIVLRARERQSSGDKLRLIADVERTARQIFPGAQATGLFVLLAYLIESLLGDQLVSFALASTGVGLMLMLAFRSVKLALVALLPNFFPIVVVIGAIGWIGLRINIATAMIASVSMGLTVDSTIHYISAFQRARRGGASVEEALRDCHRGVGRSLVFANIALVMGFAVLSLSHFIPLVYFGLLLGAAMIGGLTGVLFLLPLLLRWTMNDE